MSAASAKLGELAVLVADVQEEIGKLETARALLIAIVDAKRNDEPNPEAWHSAFAFVDAYRDEEGASDKAETMVRCAECRELVPLPSTSERRKAIECGPTHVVHFETFLARIGGGATMIEHYVAGDTVIGPNDHQPVFDEKG